MIRIPKNIRNVTIAGVVEALILTIFFQQYLPPHPLTWSLVRALTFNWTCYLIWLMGIYPNFQSPLRHLPHPQVRDSGLLELLLILVGIWISFGWSRNGFVQETSRPG